MSNEEERLKSTQCKFFGHHYALMYLWLTSQSICSRGLTHLDTSIIEIPPHILYVSQVRSLQFSSCCLFMLHISINYAVSFLVLNCHFEAFYNWICGMGFAHCWRPNGDIKLLISVSFCSLVESYLIDNHTTSSFLYSTFKLLIVLYSRMWHFEWLCNRMVGVACMADDDR